MQGRDPVRLAHRGAGPTLADVHDEHVPEMRFRAWNRQEWCLPTFRPVGTKSARSILDVAAVEGWSTDMEELVVVLRLVIRSLPR